MDRMLDVCRKYLLGGRLRMRRRRNVEDNDDEVYLNNETSVTMSVNRRPTISYSYYASSFWLKTMSFAARHASVILVAITFILLVILMTSVATELQLSFEPHDLQFQVGDIKRFSVHLSPSPNETLTVGLLEDKYNVIDLDKSDLVFAKNRNDSFMVSASGRRPGSITVWANKSTDNIYDGSQAFVRIKIKVHGYLDALSEIIGWIYFAAWSISFYPQIWLNFKRKSIVGLHLDFVALNIVGFVCYSLFNCGLYFDENIQSEYFTSHPRGVNPVQLNDVVFSLHAVVAVIITVIQALIFERGDQKVSRTCMVLLGIAFTFIGVSLVLTLEGIITWLTYLYYFSYVKLALTIVKYMPQAYFNFQRKSTHGWCIGNILLDFTGGVLSMLQMFIIAYNYDDWGSLFGDPTKFGLGLFSILFDILFMIQHYCLYGSSAEFISSIDGSKVVSPSSYRIMSSSSEDNYVACDPNVHRSYQVQESYKNDNDGGSSNGINL